MSDRAQDYARYRPSYPEGAIAAILADLGDPQELVVADIGAGTGISSRLLGDRGPRVIALEPNAAMGEAAEPHPQVSFQPGTAEQTGLVDQSIHVITCCQAFHWFNAPLALAEFSRILQPGGRVALLWNDWDLDAPSTEAYHQMIRAAATHAIDHHDHTQSPHQGRRPCAPAWGYLGGIFLPRNLLNALMSIAANFPAIRTTQGHLHFPQTLTPRLRKPKTCVVV
jgi:SAM-dependent methyltransferase